MKFKLLFVFAFFAQFCYAQLPINHSVSSNICDTNLDGVEMVNLPDFNNSISSNSNYIFSYHNAYADALAGINPIQQNQIINGMRIFYVRVQDSTSSTVDIATLTLDLINCQMGTGEVEKENLKITPNPAIYYVFIESNEMVEKSEVFSAEGKFILVTKEQKIDLSNIPSGIYFLKIYRGGKVDTKKLIKK